MYIILTSVIEPNIVKTEVGHEVKSETHAILNEGWKAQSNAMDMSVLENIAEILQILNIKVPFQPGIKNAF